jgi:hypothetical protein
LKHVVTASCGSILAASNTLQIIIITLHYDWDCALAGMMPYFLSLDLKEIDLHRTLNLRVVLGTQKLNLP